MGSLHGNRVREILVDIRNKFIGYQAQGKNKICGERSDNAEAGVRCLYRKPEHINGEMADACAFGCLIPNKLYNEEFENLLSGRLIDGNMKLRGWLAQEYPTSTLLEIRSTIAEAQYKHDKSQSVDSFIVDLDRLIALTTDPSQDNLVPFA